MNWILAVIVLLLALFILFCLLHLGILVTFGDLTAAYLSVGPIRIQIAPSRPDKGKKPKKEKAKTREESENAQNKLKKLPRPTWEDLRSAYHTLWPPMKKALRRTRRGIRVEPLRLSLILGGKEDPASAAELYGYLNAGVWTAMPVLEQLLAIPKPSIHMEIDFESTSTRAEGGVGLSLRIGTLMLVGLQIGIPALKWLLKYWKKHRKKTERPVSPESPPAETAAA